MREAMLLSRARPESCLSDLVLDRLTSEELGTTDAAHSARAHLERCAACRARLQTLEASRARFPDEVFVSGLAVQAERASRRVLPRVVAGFSAVAACVLAIVVVKSIDEPETRSKGALGLSVVARHLDGRTEEIFSGAELSPGEAIRFEVSSHKRGYLAVAGIDAAKNVTTYYPSQLMGPTAGALLDGSVTLDATLGPERIFAILCDEPIESNRLHERGLRALDVAGGNPAKIGGLDSGCMESSFVIDKVRSR